MEIPAAPTPDLSLTEAARLLAHPARWQLLRELGRGEPLPVTELARRLRLTADTASKHIAIMRKLGVVKAGYGRLYRLTPRYRPAPGTTTLDLGPCHLVLPDLTLDSGGDGQ